MTGVHQTNGRQMIRPDWDTLNPAERAAWMLIKSWERHGVIVQQAHIAAHTN